MSEEKIEYALLGGCWRIQYNPEGCGLVMCVDRGINCESHTQVVSHHTTNTPSIETVQRVVERHRKDIEQRIDGFVDFANAMTSGDPKLSAWEFVDMVGLLFIKNLLGTVAELAEKEEYGPHN